VYDVLVEMIVTRELRPGEHLVEHDLAAQLGVSRQPVREALQRFQSEGWVDLRPAVGAFVHIPTDAEADQLLAVRALLEAESARLAANRATTMRVLSPPMPLCTPM
jgi:DNA-binding GntR family transcriptional regulator